MTLIKLNNGESRTIKRKKKTWKLIYPDKTEELTNFNPIEHKKEEIIKMIKKEGDIWKSAYSDNNTLHKFIKKIVLDLELNSEMDEEVKK